MRGGFVKFLEMRCIAMINFKMRLLSKYIMNILKKQFNNSFLHFSRPVFHQQSAQFLGNNLYIYIYILKFVFHIFLPVYRYDCVHRIISFIYI